MSLVNKILKRAHGRRPVSCAPSVPSMSRGVHVPRSVASSAPSTGRGTKRHGIASDLSNTTVSSDVHTCDSTTLAHPIDVGEMLAQGHDVDIPTQLFIKSGVRKVRNKFQRNVFKSRLRPNRDTAIALTGVDLHAAVLTTCCGKRTRSSEASRRSRIATYAKCVPAPAFPTSVAKLRIFTAKLQSQHYVSIENSLRDIRRAHSKEHIWTQALQIEFDELLLSVRRGSGGTSKAGSYDLGRILSAGSFDIAPLHCSGPLFPRWFCSITSQWCCRGIESITLCLSQASLDPRGRLAKIAFLEQKGDIQERLVEVALGSADPGSTVPCKLVSLCPACTLTRYLLAIVAWHERRLRRPLSQEDREDLPLFCCKDGSSVSEQGVVATLRNLADESGQLVRDPFGKPLITKHSPRHVGMQILARAKVDLPSLCKVSRHSSRVCEGYLKEAAAEDTVLLATKVAQSLLPMQPTPVSLDMFQSPELDPSFYNGIAFLKFDSPRFPTKYHVLIAPDKSRCPVSAQKDSPWTQVLDTLPIECSRAGQSKAWPTWACKKCFHNYLHA